MRAKLGTAVSRLAARRAWSSLAMLLLAVMAAVLVSRGSLSAPRVSANPAKIWVVNQHVAFAYGVNGMNLCGSYAAAATALSSLDAIEQSSGGQLNSDMTYAGPSCVIVQTDGSVDPVVVNGRGLVCSPACDSATPIMPTAESGLGTWAVLQITGLGTFASGNKITAAQDAVTLDSVALLLAGPAHDMTLTVTKNTVQEAASSCPIQANQSLPANGAATAIYTDINGTPLVGYMPTFGTANLPTMAVGNVAGSLSTATQQSISLVQPGGIGTIGAMDSYCGVAAGTATLDATAAAGEIQGASVPFTRTALITVTGVPAAMTLSASPAAVDCNGVSSATVTATITDSQGNEVADGTPVQFSVGALGTANPVNTTTTNGQATSVITPLAGVITGIVVTVTSGNAAAQISIGCGPPGPDAFAGALVIDHIPYTISLDTTSFTTEPFEPLFCGDMGATAWFKVTLPVANVALAVDTAGSNFNTALAAYVLQPLPPGGLALLSCNSAGLSSAVSIPVSSPHTYYFQAGGAGGATGMLHLNVHCQSDLDCDGLSDAAEVIAGTDPNIADTDGDGLSDGLEVHVYSSDPLNPDTDRDGYPDGLEAKLGENPTSYCAIMRADANGDGRVNIVDLSVAALFYNQNVPPAPPRYDQGAAPDGKINIIDLSSMAAHYNQLVTACP